MEPAVESSADADVDADAEVGAGADASADQLVRVSRLARKRSLELRRLWRAVLATPRRAAAADGGECGSGNRGRNRGGDRGDSSRGDPNATDGSAARSAGNAPGPPDLATSPRVCHLCGCSSFARLCHPCSSGKQGDQQHQHQHQHQHQPRWRPNSAAVTRSGWGSSASPPHSRQASPSPSRQLPPGASDLLAEEAAADFACLDGQQLDRLSLDSLQFACWSLALSSVGTWPRGVAKSPVLVVPQPIVLASRSWLPGILAALRTRGEPLSLTGPNGRLQ